VLAITNVFAQKTPDEPYIVESNSSGEIASQFIDNLRSELKQSDERPFIISRAGKNEINNAVNLLRDNKKVLVFHAKYKNFTKLSTMNDLTNLLENCEDSTKEKLILDLN
jgi:hypothetical protein